MLTLVCLLLYAYSCMLQDEIGPWATLVEAMLNYE